MTRHCLVVLLLVSSTVKDACAEKAGWYIGAGASIASYSADIGTLGNVSPGDSPVPGWRLEAGYLWDVASAGGLHLGVAASYDDWFEANDETDGYGGTSQLRFEADTFAIRFALEQELARWVSFVFKIGPGYGSYSLGETRESQEVRLPPLSDSAGGIGWSYDLGATFFATPYLAIETTAHANWFLSNDNILDHISVLAFSTTVQYRF